MYERWLAGHGHVGKAGRLVMITSESCNRIIHPDHLVKLWLETAYRTALGKFTGSTTLAAIPVVVNSKSTSYQTKRVFENFTSPN